MGCDIHFFVEVKQPNGTWKEVVTNLVWGWDGVTQVPLGTPITKEEMIERRKVNNYNPDYDDMWDVRYYNGRNYALFSVLANVRNFEYNIKPIDDPRGLPEDVSETIKKLEEERRDSIHSQTWLTLSEIIKYNWKKVYNVWGYVEESVWHKWQTSDDLHPESYCVGSCFQEVVDEEDYLAGNIPDGEISIACKWQEPISSLCGSFYTTTIPKLKTLAKKTSDVRCVFWFDS